MGNARMFLDSGWLPKPLSQAVPTERGFLVRASAFKAFLAIAAVLSVSPATVAAPPSGAFEGAWGVKWCDTSRPAAECGGFTAFLVQDWERLCGSFNAARPGLTQIDDGAPRSIRGLVVGTTAFAAVTSGRNDAAYLVKLTRDGKDLRWKLRERIGAPGNGDIHLIALNELLAAQNSPRLEEIRAECRKERTEDPGALSTSSFPQELQGTWDIGPGACSLPVNADSDTPIRIEPGRLVGFENIDIPKRVTRLSDQTAAWVIATESNIAPGIVVEDAYVVDGDSVTVTDGESSRTYRRCHGPAGAAPQSTAVDSCPAAEFSEFLRRFSDPRGDEVRRRYTADPLEYEVPTHTLRDDTEGMPGTQVLLEQGDSRLRRFSHRYLEAYKRFVPEDVSRDPKMLDEMRKGSLRLPMEITPMNNGGYRASFGMEHEVDVYDFARQDGCWVLKRAVNLRD